MMYVNKSLQTPVGNFFLTEIIFHWLSKQHEIGEDTLHAQD